MGRTDATWARCTRGWCRASSWTLALEGNTRIVTFGNGMVAREEIVTIDPAQHRVAWAIVGQQFRHYSGAAWVEPDPKGGSRFVWTADLLPELNGGSGRADDDDRNCAW